MTPKKDPFLTYRKINRTLKALFFAPVGVLGSGSGLGMGPPTPKNKSATNPGPRLVCIGRVDTHFFCSWNVDTDLPAGRGCGGRCLLRIYVSTSPLKNIDG